MFSVSVRNSNLDLLNKGSEFKKCSIHNQCKPPPCCRVDRSRGRGASVQLDHKLTPNKKHQSDCNKRAIEQAGSSDQNQTDLQKNVN